MKPKKSSLIIKSFQELKDLFENDSFSFPDQHPSHIAESKVELNPQSEKELFHKAMEGVIPISRDNFVRRIFHIEVPEGSANKDEAETLTKLRDLVRYGKGFSVADTPEYIEGTGYNVHPEFARRLHRGDYSIQAFIDLHGLLAVDAKEVFEKFLKWAVTTGKTGILIVHGRGLSSHSEPVLKKKVIEWLTQGPWRKWIVAYSSARACDGGAGATYVLLRQRPVSKRFKRRRIEAKKR